MRKRGGQHGGRDTPKNLPDTEQEERELALYAKALGHPMRVRILRILAQQTECICGDMVALLPVAQSTVSQHLKVLKNAGLVQGEIDGPRVRYCVDPAVVRRLKTLVRAL
jgi:ArsR family transcriptional regulator, arsenate/arsenite/antimonite-responsive transcriptional repressor